MAISEKTRKIIWARSGNRCSICKKELVLEKDQFNTYLNIGEECHIISRQAYGPRHQNIVGFEYDNSDNLLLLCCNDHKTIDEQVNAYPVDELKGIKSAHELWVKNNLDGFPAVDDVKEVSIISQLFEFVASKHDIEMNIKSSKQIFESEEGLLFAFKEVENIRTKIYEIVDQLKKGAQTYNIIVRTNKNHICDIRFKGNTMLAQFYQAYANIANDSYLLFAIVKGLFDENGFADPENPPSVLKIIRLNFSFNEKGEYGWRDQQKKNDFYLSKDIVEIWADKYFRMCLT